jgi:hypothetical protein
MTNEQIRTLRNTAVPWSAVIAAIAFAWSAVGQLIAVRDDILDHCHGVELRVTAIESWRLNHEADDSRIAAMLMRIERRLSKVEPAQED